MNNRLASIVLAGALAAAAVPVAVESAAAAPVAQPLGLADAGQPEVILTSGGCGPFAHRNFYGFCRPNFGGYGWRGYGWRGYGWRGGYGWHRHYWHW